MANFNLNKAIIGGRLTSDVELKTTQSGLAVCSFTVAVTRKANRDETDFINCVAWRGTAEFISKWFKKGSPICVSGTIQTRDWQDNKGNKRTATEIIVDEALFVEGKSSGDTEQATEQAPVRASSKAKTDPINDEDELPF